MNTSTAESTATSRTTRHLDALGTLACIGLALGTLGFAAFRFGQTLPPGTSRNVDKAFFHTVNALTLSGFTTTTSNVPDYPLPGLVMLCILSVGGAMLSLAGGGYFLREALGLRLRLRTLIVLATVVIGAPALCSAIWSAFDAVSAATGLGLSSTRWPDEWTRTRFVSLSLPGLFGPAVLFALIAGRHLHADPRGYLVRCAAWLAVLYLVGIVLVRVAVTADWTEASLASLNIRGLGLAGQRFDMPSTAGWMTLLLMLPGAGPASTGGGLTILPLVMTAQGVLDMLRGRPVDRLLAVAILWIAAYVAVIAAVVLCLATIEPTIGGERLLLLAVSAVGNVGISHEPIGLSGGSLFALGGGMIVGRLLPLAMLCLLAIVAAVPVAPAVERRDADGG